MNICDRKFRKTGEVEPARHVINIDSGEQIIHLCDEEFQEVMEFITRPKPPDKPKKRGPGRPRLKAA